MNRAAAVLVFFLAGPAAGADWSVEAYSGNAYNFRSGLQITQEGGYSESVRADYATRGFRSPLHYMLRGARWDGAGGWEVSLLHHKLHLANPPAGVANLSVSHGFNIVSLNRAFREGDWTWRLGAGPVVTHAEAVIQGAQYHGPYRLAGIAAFAGLGRRFYVGEATYVSLEGALTAAYAKPRLGGTPGAELTVRNLALHALFGLGVDF